jgi:hypothetical protein
MTRETKLGIGVSTALLVLIVMAVARSWLGGDEAPPADSAAEVAQVTPETPAPPQPPGSTDKSGTAPAILPAGLTETSPLPPGAPRRNHPGPAPAAPGQSDAGNVLLPGSSLPVGPAIPESATDQVPLPPAPGAEQVPIPGYPGAEARPIAVAQNGQPTGDQGGQNKPRRTDTRQPTPAPPVPGDTTVPLPPAPGTTGPVATPLVGPPPPTTEELLMQQMAQADKHGKAGTPAPAGPGNDGAPSIPLPGASVNAPSVPESVPVPAPTAGLPAPAAVGQQSVSTPPPVPQPAVPDHSRPGLAGAAGGAPVLAMAGNPAGGPLPPLGAAPEAGGPHIPVPTPARGSAPAPGGPAPQVRDYMTQTIRTTDQAGTFEAISRQYYHNEKYAQALLLFNRDYPGGLDGIRDSGTQLPLGQKVALPPIAILEDRYQQQIRDFRPATAAAPPVEIARAQPTVANPLVPTPLPGGVGSNPSAVGAGPDYQVQGQGEMLYEIARLRLGDGKRWPEIYRLNPNIQPQLPIPGGTVLHLPPGARVGS